MKTSELEGAVLDWLVAKCEGYTPFSDGISWVIDDRGTYKQLPKYASDWSQGGPIIEREKIGGWWASPYVLDNGEKLGGHWYAEDTEGIVQAGPTPLIAAMRCYVASKLGGYVDVPEELV